MALDPVSHALDHEWVGPITKHQILLVVAAVLVALPFMALAKRVRGGELPKGPFWNFLEMILLFIRENVAKPNLGDEDADRYSPLLWTLFLFILVSNLLGMVPFLGSPTGDISVTVVLALVVFVVIQGSAIARLGFGHYLMSFVPRLKSDSAVMNVFLTVVMVPLVTVIEVIGMLIRSAVLAVRLFANIFAGHVALGAILLLAVAHPVDGGFAGLGTVLSLTLGLGLSMLELLVAFLQAFVFVLLTTIFLGIQLHPEH